MGKRKTIDKHSNPLPREIMLGVKKKLQENIKLTQQNIVFCMKIPFLKFQGRPKPYPSTTIPT